ncbi:MAG: hypothetical protein R3258_06800 [Acidimicrobiia bacterium]|nr:hypothetical protein [Acidimicrobiia bacterium]
MSTILSLTTACSSVVGETPTDTRHPDTTESTSTTTPMRRCLDFSLRSANVDTGALATDALHLSGERFTCSDDVVVVGSGNLTEIAAAAQLAASLSAPMLFPHPQLPAELGRLNPLRVHVVGELTVTAPPGVQVEAHDIASAAALTAATLGDTVQIAESRNGIDGRFIVEVVRAISSGDRVVTGPVASSGSAPTSPTLPPPHDIDQVQMIKDLSISNESPQVWMVPASSPEHLLLAAAAAAPVGVSVIAVDAGDILAHPSLSLALEGHSPDSTRFIGSSPAVDPWHIDVLANGVEVPGGGFLILPQDRPRRYVAFYGHPETSALGALGEQGPTATLERMEPFLDAYAGDGSQVIPAFEMIASVAAAGATDDADYSFEWPISTFDDWIATARERDVYVVLDLQPGRDDFLTQAKQYQPLLELPFVGLALDPEWRLEPDQVHLRQVGSVSSEEVNQVIHWLADLVREKGLPQKLMIVHQFRTFMIQDRELLEQRPEIQLVIQMDGDGTEPQKDNTYAALNVGAEDAFWAWGWKNFFDEDEPGPPTPESTMSKQPTPVYVSYQ